jgi:hypothetical protein
MKSRFNTGLAALATALVISSFLPVVRAAGGELATDPTGTWKVTATRDGTNQAYQPMLKLKLAADKLTGTFTRRIGQQEIEIPLEDVKREAAEISFTVTVQANGSKAVRTFHGKIVGDTIKEGTVTLELNGQDPARDHPLYWEARRIKE